MKMQLNPNLTMTGRIPDRNELLTRKPNWVSNGWAYQGASYWSPDSRNSCNLIISILLRVGLKTPDVKHKLIIELRQFTKMFLRTYSTGIDSMVPYDTYIDEHPSLTVAQKLSFKKWYEEMTSEWHNEDWLRMCYIESFLKNEFYPKYNRPRTINPFHDSFKAWMGHKIKTLENHFYPLFSHMHVKGLDSQEKKQFIIDLFRDHTNIALNDYTAFENSLTPAIMWACELPFINYLKPLMDEHEFGVFKTIHAGTNILKTSCGMKFTVPATRQSGTHATAFNNLFTNIIITLFAVYKNTNVSMSDFVLNYRSYITIVAEGDDMLYKTMNCKISMQTISDLGFRAKPEKARSLDYTSFCNFRFNSTTGTCYLDPVRTILRFGWSDIKYWHSKHKDALALAKALSIAYSCVGCPIVYPFVYHVIKTCSRTRIQVKDVIAANPQLSAQSGAALKILTYNYPVPSISDEDRLRYSELYFINVSDQKLIEEELIKTYPVHSHTLDTYIQSTYFEAWRECVKVVEEPLAFVDDASLIMDINKI